MTENEISVLLNFFGQHYDVLDVKSSKLLMQCISLATSVQQGQFAQNMQMVADKPIKIMQAADSQTDRQVILKALQIIVSWLWAIEDLPAELLKEALLPAFNQIWPSMLTVFSQRVNDIELVDACCSVVISMCKGLRSEFNVCFDQVHEQLLMAFSKNGKNFKCLETVGTLYRIGKMSDSIKSKIG